MPSEDSQKLFRQMGFNAAINNTDDHLKNFWMLCGGALGWRLSPAFDLVPSIGENSEHAQFFLWRSTFSWPQKPGEAWEKLKNSEL